MARTPPNGHRPGAPVALLTEASTANILEVPPQTLRNARCTGRGEFATLPWIKCGRLVRYHPDDLRDWIDRRRQEHAP